MSKWLVSLAALALALGAASACRSDVPPFGGGGGHKRPTPLPITDVEVPFQLVSLPNGQPARLEIPRRFLPTARAAGLDPSPESAGVLGTLRQVGGGLALSLSLALGGLWLFRGRRRALPG